MLIKKITVHTISVPLPEPFGFSQGWVTRRSSVLIEIEAADGTVGWGEALCHGLQPPELAAGIIEALYAPYLLGKPVSDIEVHWEQLYNLTRPYGQGGLVINALSGVDIALWDLWGKLVGQPVSNLLGGRFRERVQPYVTAFYRKEDGVYPEDGLAEADGHLAERFRALKLKVGFGVSEDIDFIRRVRDHLPDDVQLMADANCAYAVPAAREILQQVADCRLTFFEEPLAPEDLEGYRLLRSLGAVPLAAGENLLGKHAVSRWLSGGALDYFQPDLCSAGGFTEVKKIAALCQAWHTPLVPHVWGSGIGLAASLQLIASLPPTPLSLNPIEPLLEYDRSDHPFRVDLIQDGLTRDDEGFVLIPARPGIGVEVDRAVLERFQTS